MIYSLLYPVLFFGEFKSITFIIFRVKNHKILGMNLQKFVVKETIFVVLIPEPAVYSF